MTSKMMCIFAIQHAIAAKKAVRPGMARVRVLFPTHADLRKRALPLAEDIKPPEGESHAILSGASFPWSVVQLHFASLKESKSPPASEGSSSRASSPARRTTHSEEEQPPNTAELLDTEMFYTRATVGKIHLLHCEKTMQDPPGWISRSCSAQVKVENAESLLGPGRVALGNSEFL